MSSRDHAHAASDGQGNPTLADIGPAPVVGFTGTRNGLRAVQRGTLIAWFSIQPRGVLHHGDCVGADAAAHEIAAYRNWRIEIHPGLGMEHLRAFKTGAAKHHTPKPHLLRNSDIVRVADELLACPDGPETRRSGTWSTIRKARAKGIRRTIIWPDGSVTVEPGDCEGYGTEQPQTAGQVPGMTSENGLAAMEDCVAALTSKDEEIERLTTHSLDVQMRLQAICETLGCPPGLNRLRFLEAVASKLQASEAQSERLRGALEDGKVAMEDLLMTYLDESEHGGGADDEFCEICEKIRNGQDWLRSLAALSLPLETKGNIVSRDQSPTTCAAPVASDVAGQERIADLEGGLRKIIRRATMGDNEHARILDMRDVAIWALGPGAEQ